MNRERFYAIVALALTAVTVGAVLSGSQKSASGAPPKGPSYTIVKLIAQRRRR